jgi:predicted  nucleic acid-binding Zn-ribbon protein
MKKAFDANVSRARPRLRLGAMLTQDAQVSDEVVEAIAQQVVREDAPVIPNMMPAVSDDLGDVVKARIAARSQRPSAAEAFAHALQTPAPQHAPAAVVTEPVAVAAAAPVMVAPAPVAAVQAPAVVAAAPVSTTSTVSRPVAAAEPPPGINEVQTAPVPLSPELTPMDRRERLKERLRAVRENPRPEPLPETVAEAGVLAVERIAALQTELSKARAMNLALAQDLEAARRQSERATEEARLRMDEARRLSAEMEGRVKLLHDLERELSSLEGERNEALLTLQEARQELDQSEAAQATLRQDIAARDEEVRASLAEEERLAGELEAAQEAMGSLRRSTDALISERDTLARQVADLTRERGELLEARKALEAVHRALSSATMR